ncbi:ABC transporter ATP-binding protein [Maricaulis sp.]|uniref:ABC transporter ATP-binding protein n=1 Tax=Maricaulis sp. TaxID=1486257 RepID=UPI003A923DE7
MSDDVYIRARDLCIDFPVAAGRALDDSEGGGPASAGRFVTVNKSRYLRAIDHMSFDVEVGERIGIWGKNGSGKTTLLRALRGVYAPTAGEVEVGGRIQSFFNLSFGMNDDATGYENILLRGVLMGATPAQMRQLTEEIAAFSELGEFLNMPLRSYSAGMRMRLGFSVALALPSDILLMDEWLSVGDVDFRRKASDRLKAFVQASKLLVIASHNRKMLDGLCTRIFTIDGGCIVSDEQIRGKNKGVRFAINEDQVAVE